MATRLKLILKKPIFGLAFKGLVFGAFLYFYYLNPSLWRGLIFAVAAFWLYNQPIFNFSSLLPTLLVLLSLALGIGEQAGLLNLISLAVLTFLFAIILGIKNLILINRLAWHYFITFVLSYLVFLNFFLLDKSSFFSVKWLAALLLIVLLFRDIFSQRATVAIMALLIGEIIWLTNWLPIGPLSSANLSMLCLVFLVDALHYHRLEWKKVGLFIVLLFVVLFSSYWRL